MWVRCPVQLTRLHGEPRGTFQCVLKVHHCGPHDYDPSPKPGFGVDGLHMRFADLSPYARLGTACTAGARGSGGGRV